MCLFALFPLMMLTNIQLAFWSVFTITVASLWCVTTTFYHFCHIFFYSKRCKMATQMAIHPKNEYHLLSASTITEWKRLDWTFFHAISSVMKVGPT